MKLFFMGKNSIGFIGSLIWSLFLVGNKIIFLGRTVITTLQIELQQWASVTRSNYIFISTFNNDPN